MFWIFAGNAARVEDSYRAISDSLHLNDQYGNTADTIRLVVNWLSNEINGRWLIIVDNADAEIMMDQRVEDAGKMSSLANLLPQTNNGAILVTSRNIDVAKKLVHYEKDIINVPEMGRDEANKLLKAKLMEKPTEHLGELAPELLRALDCIPLAITQAAAYINRLPSPTSILKYLDELRALKGQIRLLEKDLPDGRRDEHSANSVLTTWQISFEHIRSTWPSAANLLSFMSYFHRQAIPEFILHHYVDSDMDEESDIVSYKKSKFDRDNNVELDGDRECDVNGKKEEHVDTKRRTICRDKAYDPVEEEEGDMIAADMHVSRAQDAFEEDLWLLQSFSLVKVTKGGDEFDMHRLVQFATRRWLKLNGVEDEWRNRFLAAMATRFPLEKYENWPTCRALFPHIQSVIENKPSSHRQALQWAQLLENAAFYAIRQGLFVQAESMARKSLDARLKELGEDHLETLYVLRSLAAILSSQARYAEAEDLALRSLAGIERALGKEHPSTLASVNILGCILKSQGKRAAAEDMFRRAFEGRKKVLGEEHPETLSTTANLAHMLSIQRINEAEEMARRALVAREKVLGEEHPDTLHSMTTLVEILFVQEKDEAEEMARRALVAREKVLGEEHPDTLFSVLVLANGLAKQGRYDEAICLYERACLGHEKIYGASHPSSVLYRKALSLMLQLREEERISTQVQPLQVSSATNPGSREDAGLKVRRSGMSRLSRKFVRLGIGKSEKRRE